MKSDLRYVERTLTYGRREYTFLYSLLRTHHLPFSLAHLVVYKPFSSHRARAKTARLVAWKASAFGSTGSQSSPGTSPRGTPKSSVCGRFVPLSSNFACGRRLHAWRSAGYTAFYGPSLPTSSHWSHSLSRSTRLPH
jgi:hypothetical protein